jgi:hypothetical protein
MPRSRLRGGRRYCRHDVPQLPQPGKKAGNVAGRVRGEPAGQTGDEQPQVAGRRAAVPGARVSAAAGTPHRRAVRRSPAASGGALRRHSTSRGRAAVPCRGQAPAVCVAGTVQGRGVPADGEHPPAAVRAAPGTVAETSPRRRAGRPRRVGGQGTRDRGQRCGEPAWAAAGGGRRVAVRPAAACRAGGADPVPSGALPGHARASAAGRSARRRGQGRDVRAGRRTAAQLPAADSPRGYQHRGGATQRRVGPVGARLRRQGELRRHRSELAARQRETVGGRGPAETSGRAPGP